MSRQEQISVSVQIIGTEARHILVCTVASAVTVLGVIIIQRVRIFLLGQCGIV